MTFSGLPDFPALVELKRFRAWVGWNPELRNGRPTKLPINPHTGKLASVSDAATWGTYQEAVALAKSRQLAGIGIVLSADDDLIGIDLDHCIDLEDEFNPVFEEWAREILDLKETYAETSPSGTGIRLFAHGKEAAGLKNNGAGVEIYMVGRYLTVTGQHIAGTPDEINPAPKTLAALRERAAAFAAAQIPAPPLKRTRDPDKASGGAQSAPQRSFAEGHEDVQGAHSPNYRAGPLLRSLPGDKSEFFHNIKEEALKPQALAVWVPKVFGSDARFYPSTGAWRVTSKALGRNLEEDLSITPQGIQDFGEEQGLTAIDVVMNFGNAPNATLAAFWLCDAIGVSREKMGWKEASPMALARENAREREGEFGAQGAQLKLRWPFPIDPATIPRRPWIVRGLLLRKQLSVLVAPGGSSKSMIASQIAIMSGFGSQWGPWRPHAGRTYRTLIINLEDDADEMNRRLLASAHVMGADQALLTNRIAVITTDDNAESFVVVSIDSRTRNRVVKPIVDQLIKLIKENSFDVVIADPFSETFEGDESSNSEAKWAVYEWRRVAREGNCAVLLLHHTRKGSGSNAGDPDVGRGASAIRDMARVMSTMFTMTRDEAEALGIEDEDRIRYVRFDDAKSNQALLGRVRWFERRSTSVGNALLLASGLEDPDNPGDEVGVLVPWVPPGPLKDIADSEINRVLDLIETGISNKKGDHEPYSNTSKGGGGRWVGSVLMAELALNAEEAKFVIGVWLKTGLLLESQEHVPSTKRPLASCVRVNNVKRPGNSSAETWA